MDQKSLGWAALIRLGIAVEGDTEVEFVKNLLGVTLRDHEVEPTPVPIDGGVSLASLAREMANLFWSFDCVSSFVDFYGFRGKGELSVEDLEAKLFQSVSGKVRQSFNQSRVIPYVQRHEFEGLLFSRVECFRGIADLKVDDTRLESLRRIRKQFESPEEINDDVNTAPSKRLLALMSNYRKRLHGPLIGEDIGLAVIRAECPRFDDWVKRLSQLNVLVNSSP